MTTTSAHKCPLCDQSALSQHHIVPRSEGGTDEPRNLVWLCQQCHDEVEGLEFTPELMLRLRKEKLGAKATSHEEYWWLHKDEGITFAGILLPGQKSLITYNVFFPYDSQFEMPLGGENHEDTANNALKHPETPVYKGEAEGQQINPSLTSTRIVVPTISRAHRGRPRYVIPDGERIILEDGGTSLLEKAKALRVSVKTVRRRLKEAQASYITES